MKKLAIITLILAAGLTAFPQNASRSRQAKSKSSSSVSRSSSSRAKATSPGRSSSSRVKATSPSRSSSSKSKATKSRSGSSSVSSRTSGSKGRFSQSGRSAVQVRSSRSSSGNSSARTTERIAKFSNNPRSSVSTSSAHRSNGNGSKVYERRDGKKFQHDNDRVFATRKYRVDYRDANNLRRSNDFRRVYSDYNRWYRNRHHRHVVVRSYHLHAPLALEIRRVRYPYRRPLHIDLCWTPFLHQRFMYYYPLHNNWNSRYGDYIESISSYEAINYAGSVKRVYGKVKEVYYSPEDRTYTLYFGAPFPYHDFSVVIPKRIAKSISWSPTWHFEDEHVWVVGLVDVWENKAEIVINDEDQIRRY